jgi:N-acetylglutamate synthase-like GNAT family acetyltransferase
VEDSRPGGHFATVIHIRPATTDDAEAILGLLNELGHSSSAGSVAKRIESLSVSGCHAACLAVDGGKPVGLLTLNWQPRIYLEHPIARITALVVHQGARRHRVGCMLVEHALAIAQRMGCGEIEVTTGLQRTDAQEFYRALGFSHSAVRYKRAL